MVTEPRFVVGNRIRPRAVRAPRRIDGERTCTEPGCATRLSTYNPLDTCFQHSPTRFPRIRGRG